MSEHAWLAELQVGDQIIMCTHTSKEIRRVARVTPTHILVGEAAVRFRRKDGGQPGRDFHRAFLTPYTPEAADAIHHTHLRQATYSALSYIHRYDVDRLTDDQCQSILTLLRSLGLA